jgi:hypothetical protein
MYSKENHGVLVVGYLLVDFQFLFFLLSIHNLIFCAFDCGCRYNVVNGVYSI